MLVTQWSGAAVPVVAGADGTYADAAAQVAALVGSTPTTDPTLSTCISDIVGCEPQHRRRLA